MTAITNIATLYREREALPLRTRLLCMFGAVAALHAAAVVLLFAGSTGSTGGTGTQALTWGLVLTAYLAGVKHSYDWDHIAAIDNSTRKFVADRQDPVSVGFAFSMGHSTVVTLAGVLVVAGAAAVGELMQDGSAGNLVLGLAGSGVFGLGFDTATTIGLLMMTTAASLAGVPPFALLALPLAFTAAMTLCDSLNGMAMMQIYRSALADPQRKLGFNALVTGISAVSALFIAAITLGGFVHAAFALDDPLTVWLGSIDLGESGLLLVALLLAVWGGAALTGRLRQPSGPCSYGASGASPGPGCVSAHSTRRARRREL
jgi:high-affinity nickel-transport protein